MQHLPLPGLSLLRQKATDQWIAVQNNRLPDCPWQHLVFTLPDTLWPLFFYNRWLLDALFRLAADNLIYAAKRRGLRVGIFGRCTPMAGGSLASPRPPVGDRGRPG